MVYTFNCSRGIRICEFQDYIETGAIPQSILPLSQTDKFMVVDKIISPHLAVTGVPVSVVTV